MWGELKRIAEDYKMACVYNKTRRCFQSDQIYILVNCIFMQVKYDQGNGLEYL